MSDFPVFPMQLLCNIILLRKKLFKMSLSQELDHVSNERIPANQLVDCNKLVDSLS